MKEISAIANGRIILSGEYSINYGKTAIAFPMNKFTTCSIKETLSGDISIELKNFFQERIFLVENIKFIGFEIEKRYSKFLKGKITSKFILNDVFDLPIYILYIFSTRFKVNISNISISIDSDLEIGVGLGSSSAFIISILKALLEYYNLHIDDNEILSMGSAFEKLIHGFSNELDIAVALYNKPVKYRKGFPLRILPSRFLNFFIVNSGKSDCHSKECFDYVKNSYDDKNLWLDFDKVALNLEDCIINNNSSSISECIKDNNKLLCKIGVVPSKVQDFIFEVESLGGVAKISGNGSIRGDKVGVILVGLEDENIVKKLCNKYNYNFYGKI